MLFLALKVKYERSLYKILNRIQFVHLTSSLFNSYNKSTNYLILYWMMLIANDEAFYNLISRLRFKIALRLVGFKIVLYMVLVIIIKKAISIVLCRTKKNYGRTTKWRNSVTAVVVFISSHTLWPYAYRENYNYEAPVINVCSGEHFCV